MNLTPEQKQTLKTWLLANAQMMNDQEAADALNATASPDFWVWRTSVTQDEIMQNGFDWTRVDNLSVGKARIWEWLFNNQNRAFNPAKANVRAAIDATWVGTAADLQQRAAVYAHCRRRATLAEKLLASGTGTTEAPATMGSVPEGQLSAQDVIDAYGA